MISAFDLPESHPLRVAHEKSIYHRAEIERSAKCGCFFCEAIFDADQITDWRPSSEMPHAQQTALCPFCGIDSVIGDNSGFEITKRFLQEMQDVWFDGCGPGKFRQCAP